MVRCKRRERLRRILGWTVMGLLVILLGCSFVLARRHVSYAIYPSRTAIRIQATGKGLSWRKRPLPVSSMRIAVREG